MHKKEVIEQLKGLKQVVPAAEWKKANRDVLLRFIQSQKLEARPSVAKVAWNLLGNGFRHTIFQPASVLLLLLGTVIGSSLVVNAAFYSLPGEPLYALKIRMEKAQVALTPNQTEKTELRVELAKKRVDELDRIIVRTEKPEEKVKRVHLALTNFKKSVESFRQEIESDIPNDTSKDRNYKIALSLSDATKELKETLDKSNEILTPEVKKNLETAINSAEDTGISALSKNIYATHSATSTEPENTQKTEEVSELLLSTIQSISQQNQDAIERVKSFSGDKATIDPLLQNLADTIEASKQAITDQKFEDAITHIQSAKQLIAELKVLLEPGTEVPKETATPDEAVKPTENPNSQSTPDDSVVTTPEIVPPQPTPTATTSPASQE